MQVSVITAQPLIHGKQLALSSSDCPWIVSEMRRRCSSDIFTSLPREKISQTLLCAKTIQTFSWCHQKIQSKLFFKRSCIQNLKTNKCKLKTQMFLMGVGGDQTWGNMSMNLWRKCDWNKLSECSAYTGNCLPTSWDNVAVNLSLPRVRKSQLWLSGSAPGPAAPSSRRTPEPPSWRLRRHRVCQDKPKRKKNRLKTWPRSRHVSRLTSVESLDGFTLLFNSFTELLHLGLIFLWLQRKNETPVS